MEQKNNKVFSEIKQFGIIFMPINWGVCLIVTLILYFVANTKEWWFYYLLGSATSYLTFALHMKEANDYGSPKANATMKLFTGFWVRLLVSAAMLAVTYFISTKEAQMENLICCFAGLLAIKFVLIVFTIIREIKNKKKGLEKPIQEVKDTPEGGEEIQE